MKKQNIAFTKEKREAIIDMALGWFEDWKLNEPTVYTETVEERKSLMLPLNNSELIKHIEKFYGVVEGEIWDYINSNC
tara:strand:- start:304 stop:537 length:234 start_codon:yes stop_codon:yes gene_type:complete